MGEALREAGVWGFALVGLFVLGLVPAVISLLVGGLSLASGKGRTWARVACGVGFTFATLAFVTGGVGTMLGRKATRRAIDSVTTVGEQLEEPGLTPSWVPRLEHQGYLESRRASEIAAVLGGVIFIFSALGLALSLGRARPQVGGVSVREGGQGFALATLGVAVLAIGPLAYAGTRPVPPEPPPDPPGVASPFAGDPFRGLGAPPTPDPGEVDPHAPTDPPVPVDPPDPPDGPRAVASAKPLPAPSPAASTRPADRGEATGTLGREDIRRVIQAHRGELNRCYERALVTSPTLEGRVTVRFVIGSDGHVVLATDDGSDLPDPSAVQCVVTTFRKMIFPAPQGGTVTVRYPVIFRPA